MANIKGGVKRAAQALVRRAKNRATKAEILTINKKLLAALAAGDKGKSEELFRQFSSILDKSAKKRIIAKNNASRKKSRLALRMAKLK